jgi:teichuronic acid biosynthesis glycosyltransferase TuaG
MAAASVSVIIPTWNRRESLVVAVKSALEQTVPVLEVLVCDDGSDDGSREAVEALGDVRVRWIGGPRAGRPAVPRNRGIRESRGEWLAFLDSDDAWLPAKLESQFDVLNHSGHHASCTNAWRVLPGAGRTGSYLRNTPSVLHLSDLLRVNSVICSSALVHRSVIEKCGGFPEAPGLRAIEDYGLWMRVAVLTPFDYLSEALVDYADEPATSVRSGTSDAELKERVMRNFAAWCAESSTGSAVRRDAGKYLRRAMKRNGKSWWQRFRLS